MQGDTIMVAVELAQQHFDGFMQATYDAGHLPMFTIYRPVTADYPGKWVVRACTVGKDIIHGSMVYLAVNLESARGAIPPGLHCMPRQDNDDLTIEEVWL